MFSFNSVTGFPIRPVYDNSKSKSLLSSPISVYSLIGVFEHDFNNIPIDIDNLTCHKKLFNYYINIDNSLFLDFYEEDIFNVFSRLSPSVSVCFYLDDPLKNQNDINPHNFYNPHHLGLIFNYTWEYFNTKNWNYLFNLINSSDSNCVIYIFNSKFYNDILIHQYLFSS